MLPESALEQSTASPVGNAALDEVASVVRASGEGATEVGDPAARRNCSLRTALKAPALGAVMVFVTLLLVVVDVRLTPGQNETAMIQFGNDDKLSEISRVQTSVACEASYIRPCIGALSVGGFGRVWLIQAGADTPGKESAPITVEGCNSIAVPMTGRAYFGAACTPAKAPFYNPLLYANMMFLGRVFSYTVDLSSADCGCIVALYLVSMGHNRQPGTCGGDFYCDAATVCGVACPEYDIMEANKHAFRTTAHAETDRNGLASGLGGQATGLKHPDYHPGSQCIDTDRPFEVAVYFAPGNSMIVTLSQRGSDCKPQLFGVKYPGLDRVLREGMTPVFSYWSAPYTGWFDGPAYTPDAPPMCAAADPGACGRFAHLSNFGLRPPPRPAPTLPPPPPGPAWGAQTDWGALGTHQQAARPPGEDTDPVHFAIRRAHPGCSDPDPMHCPKPR